MSEEDVRHCVALPARLRWLLSNTSTDPNSKSRVCAAGCCHRDVYGARVVHCQTELLRLTVETLTCRTLGPAQRKVKTMKC